MPEIARKSPGKAFLDCAQQIILMEVNVKKKLSIVLAVVLPVILLLTCVTSTVYGLCWPGGFIEDFEWGYAGCPLDDCSTHWKVVGPYTGESWAKIDDDDAHVHQGTRSAEFYRNGSKNVYAYYKMSDTSEIYYIGFYVMRGGTAYVDFRCGDGDHCIWVRIRSDGKVQWYDYPQWHTVEKDGIPVYISPMQYYKIEFKNIDWDVYPDGTFDIYVRTEQGTLLGCETEAIMHDHGGFDKGIYFENLSPSVGSYWIDDISH